MSIALAGAMATATSVRLDAQTSASDVGVVLIAHGGDSVWNAGVLEAARSARTARPVQVAFLMGPAAATHRLQDQVAKLEREGANEIVLVPLLVSSHSGHYEQIRWLAGETDSLDAVMHHHLHMAGIERPTTTARLRVARGLDDASELADVLTERAKALTPTPTSRALFLIGHGPNSAEDYAEWMKHLRRVAEQVKARTGFKDVRVDLVRDDAPAAVRAEAVLRVRELILMQAQITGADVSVVPVLVSRGSVGNQRFRADIAGLPVVYTGEPLLPHAAIARWIERQAVSVRADER